MPADCTRCISWGRFSLFASFLLTVLVLSTPPARTDDLPVPRVVGSDVERNLKAIELDQRIIAEIEKRAEIMANLQHLSDVIGPRLTGSKNLQRANEWTKARMEAYGLESVRLEPWEVPLGWERGIATMKIIEPDNGRSLMVASRAWGPGTKGKVTGDVVIFKARSKAELAAYKGRLQNAVILPSAPAEVAPISDLRYGPPPASGKKSVPKKDPKEESGKRPPPRPGTQRLSPEILEFLKSEGAACVLTDSRKPHSLLVTTGGWSGTDRVAPTDGLAELFIIHEHYALLYRLASRPGNEKTRVELEVSNKFIPGPITVFNTVGELRGSEKPDEFVVIGAHLDSWDLGSGTTDNGTGSSVVLEVARVLGALAKEGLRPKRTIRFVLFTGEEQGLHGSKQYTIRHKDEMPKTSVALVHDTGTGKVLSLGLQGREAVQKVLEPELVSLKKVSGFAGLTLDSMGGTDHLSFEAVGVPGFACRQDIDEYRLTHHTQSDTFDKAKEGNLKQGAQVLAVTIMRIANLPDLLPRDKPKK